MYPSYMNKPSFMPATGNPSFGASTSTFGQPAANTSMFPSMQPSSIFPTPSTSSFNAGPSTQAGFGTSLFGQQNQPSTSGLFGTSNNAFGQAAKPAFGFGSTTPQTGLFGQQPAQPNTTSLFQSNPSSNLFGGSAFGNQTTGTVIKFQPVTGSDTMQKNGVTQSINTKHHCITCMKEYEGKSFEELRFEDYTANRKGPQQQTGFNSTPFGAPANTTAPLFGQTDNKQAFGQQPQGFGQTPAFGQTTSAFGVTNQNTTNNLFGKPNTFGAPTSSATPAFGFNTAASTANPFSATQTQKPFSSQSLFSTTTQAQPAFGTGVFGQTNAQNTTTNLFQKPAQPAPAFGTGQTGFSFNQPATTQTTSLFQVSKPSTGFGIFGPTNTTAPAFGQSTQPSFGSTFGKMTQPTFTQPTQPAFGTTAIGGGLPQQPLFGGTTSKPSTIFGNTNTGGGLFNNNVFQQPQSNFSLNMNQQQPNQFPDATEESKNITILATDSFPDGPHILGLDPILGDLKNSTTNPKDLKALLDYSKKRDELMGTSAKIKVQVPKPKRGSNFTKEFFETNQSLRGSQKCLVIRKFNENSSTIYNKYKNELLEEAAEILKTEQTPPEPEPTTSPKSTVTEPIPEIQFSDTLSDYKGRLSVKFQFDSLSDDSHNPSPRINDDSGRCNGSVVTSTSGSSGKSPPDSAKKSVIVPPLDASIVLEEEEEVIENESGISMIDSAENPSGVVLTKPEYYMYPEIKDLHQYMNDKGECIVQGLTLGRRGYGNVYFPDPINITNMNFDDIVRFRHKEVVIYPEEGKKPPVGEGINRRAQVTLEKIFPREKGTNNYITDVNQIIQSNFVENLMHVTQKHNCKFVDYRPKSGSWVFKVKHFSKYGLTDSDEEECEVAWEKAIPKKIPLEFWPEEVSMLEEDIFHTDSSIQPLKSSLFINVPKMKEKIIDEIVQQKIEIPCEVIATPKVYKLPDVSLMIVPEKTTSTQRIYTEMAIFKSKSYKAGWAKGFHFYGTDSLAESEIIYSLVHCNVDSETKGQYDHMMPSLKNMLQITLDESEFNFDSNGIPTLKIKRDHSFLKKQTELFENHVKNEEHSGSNRYLSSIWGLCTALWGPDGVTNFERRQNLSNWLKKYTDDSSKKFNNDSVSESFKTIFKLLTMFKIDEASEFASKNKLSRISLIISQMSGNERLKYWTSKQVESFEWKEKGIVLDEFKRLYLLLSGIAFHNNINTCADLDWMRSFGVHLWYATPSAATIDVAFNMYKKAFTEFEYATKPIPLYCDSKSDTEEFDLLYHILALYVDCTYQLSKLLHPETHTENIMDYRLSWFLMQLFLSLKVGLITNSEKDVLHTTFATQLENMGEWKWAIFALLFMENNLVKRNMIMKILDRHLDQTSDIEKSLVQTFKIPAKWIHEVKATKAKISEKHYDYFQHVLHMGDYNRANNAMIEHILPDLFINEELDHLRLLIGKIVPYSGRLVDWYTQVGLIWDFLDLDLILGDGGGGDTGPQPIYMKLNYLLSRINCFPSNNDLQKLCVTELSRKCALLFKYFQKRIETQNLETKVVGTIGELTMPSDIKHHEFLSVIDKFVHV